MRRTVCRSEVLRVTSVAVRRRPLVLAPDVAGGAIEGGVRSSESETGVFQVIEFCAEPRIHAVAGLAGSREVEHLVIRFGCLLEVGHVAREAFRRQSDKLTHGLTLMAVGTFQQRVRSQQRESVVMLLQLIGANVPALDGMTLGAIRPKLAAVNISVAACTIVADIFKHQIGMTLRA